MKFTKETLKADLKKALAEKDDGFIQIVAEYDIDEESKEAILTFNEAIRHYILFGVIEDRIATDEDFDGCIEYKYNLLREIMITAMN